MCKSLDILCVSVCACQLILRLEFLSFKCKIRDCQTHLSKSLLKEYSFLAYLVKDIKSVFVSAVSVIFIKEELQTAQE